MSRGSSKKDPFKVTKRQIDVVQDEDEPVPEKILAKSIVAISDAVTNMKKVVTKRCIVVLLADASGQSMTACAKVLDALEELKGHYVK